MRCPRLRREAGASLCSPGGADASRPSSNGLPASLFLSPPTFGNLKPGGDFLRSNFELVCTSLAYSGILQTSGFVLVLPHNSSTKPGTQVRASLAAPCHDVAPTASSGRPMAGRRQLLTPGAPAHPSYNLSVAVRILDCRR